MPTKVPTSTPKSDPFRNQRSLIQAWCSPALASAAKARAEAEGRTTAFLIREAVRRYLLESPDPGKGRR